MPTLPNMGLITPTLGGDSGEWDDKINACLGLIDAHDHTPGKGPLVPVAGLDIDADIAMGGLSVTSVGSVDFTAIAAPSSGSKRLFVSSADNELYWRTNGGANVKLTNGASINTTLVGGIVGDYSSVGAEVAYDNSNTLYTFKDQSSPSKKWARLSSGPVRIHEFNTTESVYVEFAVAAGLAAPYTVTWPAGLDASQTAVQIQPDGDVVFSNTFTEVIVAPDFYYEEQPLSLPASAALDVQGSHTKFISGTLHAGWTLAASVNPLQWPLPIRAGDWIGTWTVYLDKNTDGLAQIEAQVYKINGATGAVTGVGGGDTNTANAPNFITLTETIDEMAVEGFQYLLVVTPSGSVTSAADVLYHAEVGIYRQSP